MTASIQDNLERDPAIVRLRDLKEICEGVFGKDAVREHPEIVPMTLTAWAIEDVAERLDELSNLASGVSEVAESLARSLDDVASAADNIATAISGVGEIAKLIGTRRGEED
jgi:hypothetical protein